MADRIILHSDMNSFYASVEMMLKPSLRGKAVAVCGSTEDRHGIVLAKSDLAKKAGVKTGMVNWEARQRCPDLVVVPPQYEQYLKYSKLPLRTQLPSEITAAAYNLFQQRYYWNTPVRAICIRAIDLCPQTDAEQLQLMVDYARRDRRVRLEDAIEGIRSRFGKQALTYAVLMGDLKMPNDGRDVVRMPGLMYQWGGGNPCAIYQNGI